MLFSSGILMCLNMFPPWVRVRPLGTEIPDCADDLGLPCVYTN